MITWTMGEASAWRNHSAHAMLLWQPQWNEGGGVVAQMAEPSLSVLIWHTQAQLDTHCSPPPPTLFSPPTHPSIQSGSRHTVSCYCLRLILTSSTLETMRSYKSQDGLQLCKHVHYKFVLYICTHNDKIIRYNAACTWPSFSEMHHWVFFLPLSPSCLLPLQFLNSLSMLMVLLLLLLLRLLWNPLNNLL